MFIYNVKVSGSMLFKIFFVIVTIIILTVFSICCYNLFVDAKNNVNVADNSSAVIEIDPKNYTNILKDSHEHIDNYVGNSYKSLVIFIEHMTLPMNNLCLLVTW